MKRQTPRKFGEVVGLGKAAFIGLLKWGGILDLRATTAAILGPLVDAVCQTNTAFQFTIDAGLKATAEQAVLFRQAGAFITLVRDNLKPTLGSQYNQRWGTVGLFNGTLAVPRQLALRLSLLQAMEQFFLKRPELEIPNVVTAAMAGELYCGLRDAMTACRNATVTQRQQKTVRDAAVKRLRERLQGLRAELKMLLAPNDPRWLEFGFKVPTDISVPEAPEAVKVTSDAGHLKASWGHTVHADRYRVYQRVVGTDAEPLPVNTTTETTFDLGTFAPGTELEVQVAAVNAAGEGRRSDVVRFLVPKEE